MQRSTFLLICALLAFLFGGLMFFAPGVAAESLGLTFTPDSGLLLRGMGGLIIGSGTINLLLRNSSQNEAIKALLLTNILTHSLGLAVDVWGVFDGILLLTKMAPVELVHSFVGIGSVIYLSKIKN